jgi:hypothetical protein
MPVQMKGGCQRVNRCQLGHNGKILAGLHMNNDQSKSCKVPDEIPVLDESSTHTTYQKIKDALKK